MRRDVTCIVLGLLLGAAPLATGQGDDSEQLAERLRSLENALHKALHRMPAVAELPAVDKRGFELALIPLADLAAGVPDFIRPYHRIAGHKEADTPLFGCVAEEAPQPYGTIEEILELVRASVWPEEWDGGGTIDAHARSLVVHHKPAMVRGVRAFLERDLRTRSHRSVLVRAEIVQVSMAFFRGLAALKDATLPSAMRFALDEAIKSKAARVLFSGRVTGLAKQRVVLWHGRQVAVMADADVEVAESAKTSDPIIDVVQAGGYVSVRTEIDGNERLRMDIAVGLDELNEPIGTRQTNESGVLDMAEVSSVAARSTIVVPRGTWAMIGNALASKDWIRIILVRGDVLERGRAK